MRSFSAVGRSQAVFLLGSALLFSTRMPLLAQQRMEVASSDARLTAEQVAAKLEEESKERAQALHEFEGLRVYRMQYRGFPSSKEAEMRVLVNFQAPASKRFTVVSQDGSKLIIERVLKKLMQSEQEAMDAENQRRTALTRENYDFVLIGYEQRPDGDCYVLAVTPRTRNKFLYRGKIWVNAKEFAVARIEAEPAKSPSFWIKKTRIEHEYVKVGDFWFPARNRTESQIRLGGLALLTIDYTDYKIISVTHDGKVESADPQAKRGGE